MIHAQTGIIPENFGIQAFVLPDEGFEVSEAVSPVFLCGLSGVEGIQEEMASPELSFRGYGHPIPTRITAEDPLLASSTEIHQRELPGFLVIRDEISPEGFAFFFQSKEGVGIPF